MKFKCEKCFRETEVANDIVIYMCPCGESYVMEEIKKEGAKE